MMKKKKITTNVLKVVDFGYDFQIYYYGYLHRIRGAMVARLTPDQKVACSIHVGFKTPVL